MVSSNIKFLRAQTGLNQTEFGKLFGCTRGMIQTYERGVADPSTALLSKIAKHFNISVEKVTGKNLQANPGLVVPGGHIEPAVNEVALLREMITDLKEQVVFLKTANEQQRIIIERLTAPVG